MTATQLLPQLRQLSRIEKLHVMQFLISELAQEESDSLQPGLDYPVWSPDDAFEAAETMLQLLEAAKKEDNHTIFL